MVCVTIEFGKPVDIATSSHFRLCVHWKSFAFFCFSCGHWIKTTLKFLLIGLKIYLHKDMTLFLHKLSYLIAPYFEPRDLSSCAL